MYSNGRYHETLGYLHIQFGNLDQACLDYLNAIEAFQRDDDQDSASQLTERLTELNCELENRSKTDPDTSLSVHLKVEILRLCRLALRYSHQYQHQIALNVLERGLQLSDILVDVDQQQGQYCAAIVLDMMGKIYHTQRYYLFALASFKASLEAYETLSAPSEQTQSRMATVSCTIANIAEITNHPDVAIEYYLDALWYLNTSDQQPQAKQVAQQLNNLCTTLQSASINAS
jgi:tetratricopeptide (TPR) repeat protein